MALFQHTVQAASEH